MSRIVLVEDDAFTREDLYQELTGAGHDVAVHSGGNEALETILSDPPDVIVTDIVMEEGEGMDLITKAREQCPSVSQLRDTTSRPRWPSPSPLPAISFMSCGKRRAAPTFASCSG